MSLSMFGWTSHFLPVSLVVDFLSFKIHLIYNICGHCLTLKCYYIPNTWCATLDTHQSRLLSFKTNWILVLIRALPSNAPKSFQPLTRSVMSPACLWGFIGPMCLYYFLDLLFPSLTEQDHLGPSDIQRGSFPTLSRGALGEHHQRCCPNGWLFLHAWRPSWTHRGWVQRSPTGPPGLAERVHE